MALIQFTRNHNDHSTDKGFQFEFFCDRCGNGFMTEFQPSAMGLAGRAGSRARPRLSPGRRGSQAQFPSMSEVLALGVPERLLERKADVVLRMRTGRGDRTGSGPGASHHGPAASEGAGAGSHQRPRPDVCSGGALSQLRGAYAGRQILPRVWQALAAERGVSALRHACGSWREVLSRVRQQDGLIECPLDSHLRDSATSFQTRSPTGWFRLCPGR